ncbi:hypothetical protein JTE90_027850 [Oedothorax gibbosus]|uniref:separase n=1 Tax=Oedothorax gibbosus TaxID=931172 RepID=A0AAV6TL06_9ARAC|nr:hypothetical protein JTE90_027850 [Oedothorax gibbosus]
MAILYPIISVYLKLGKYEDSLTLASDVQKVFLKDYRATVVRVIYLLIKNETGGDDPKNLFKEAKNFIAATLKKLKTSSRNEEFQAILSSYAKSIGSIGFSSYNCGYYSESIYFLETGLKLAIFDEAEKSYKWKEILIYCYLLSGNHKVALQYVASLMVNCKDKTKECFKLWHRVKAGALKNYNTALNSCTISDLVAEMELKLSREEEISLLVEEFSGCKLERNVSEDEVLNIVKELMRLQCSGIKWAYVMLVSITMGVSRSQKISSLINKSSLDMCLESVNVFETFVSENPTNSEAKIQLSINYVWLYLIKLTHLHKLATKEGSTYSKPKPDEESESDIQPTIPLLTFLVEAETLKCLEKALDIWTGISNDSKTSWSELAETVKHWDLLTLIQTTAEFLAISANDVLELRSWILLHTVSIALKNKECELLSAISLVNFFVKMGYLDMASHLLKINDISFYKGDEYNMLKLKFYLAESNFFLHAGKFDEGLILLRQVFADSIFEQLYTSVKILHIQAMLIQSKYLTIPPSGFTDFGNLEFLSGNTATSSAMDCARAAKRLLKILCEKTTFEGPHNDWVIQRTQTVKYLLNANFLLAEHYVQIGDPRFARCFLLEGLKVAEENILTYWSSKMLILLGQVDLMRRDLNDCTVKLNCLKYVMDENSKENAEMLLHKAFNKTEISEPTEETEDYIIPIETRLKLPRAIKQNFINTNVHSSPIPLETETNSKFEVKSNPFSGHNTYYVYWIKLEMWALSCMQLITEDKKALAETQLNKLLKKCELMRSTKFLKVNSILKSSNVNWHKDSLTRVPSLPEKTLTVTALCKLSLLHFVKEEFELTNSCIDSALKILMESSNYGKYLHSITYGLLKYHKIVVTLKNIIQIKHDICLESALCPAVDIKGLATKRILQDSSILNMTPQKVVPKIQISPCARKRIVKAPKKKDVLPAHIKKDIDSSAKSNEFPSLIFSSSDDEFLSVPPAPKKSSKKTYSSSSKRRENEENSYKLFDPKNVVLNINASSDIWKLADLSTPKSNKSSSERRTRQAVRNAKSENKSSSKFLDPQLLSDRLMAATRSTRSRSTKTCELYAAQNSLEENKTWEHSVSEERRVSVEHYRGTSKTLQRKNVMEDIDMEEDVFLPDCSETVSNSGVQIKSSNGKQPSFLEKLCEDLTSMDITESSNTIVKHKIPEEKLTEFINELDEVRLLIQHIAPYPLYVNLCKLLAILIMHNNKDSPTLYDSAFLFSETFASVLRQIYLGQYYVFNTNKNADNTQFKFSRLLKRKDACIINQMESMLNVIPAGFTVVQITALFEKEIDKSSMSNVSKLVICRYQNNTQPLVMGLDCSTSEMSTTSIFADFSNILSESTLVMKNSDDRKKWWSTRTTLDGRLQTLVKGMEDFWLGCWKGLLLSSATTEKRKKNLKKIVNSLCKLSEPSNKILLEVLLDSSTSLSSEQLSAAICHLWKCKPIDNIFSQVWKLIHEKMPSELADTKRNPLVLILDKDLQALPWESLPILNDVPVSRMPSLNIMISKLSMPETKSALQEGLNCNNAYYILNPEGDLKSSQAYLQPIFEKQANWEGVTGKPPSAEECALALKNRDLFVYCGHGSGKQYVEGKTMIHRMLFRASAILMGCSSGRLKQCEKQLESYGVPLTYLMNGR